MLEPVPNIAEFADIAVAWKRAHQLLDAAMRLRQIANPGLGPILAALKQWPKDANELCGLWNDAQNAIGPLLWELGAANMGVVSCGVHAQPTAFAVALDVANPMPLLSIGTQPITVNDYDRVYEAMAALPPIDVAEWNRLKANIDREAFELVKRRREMRGEQNAKTAAASSQVADEASSQVPVSSANDWLSRDDIAEQYNLPRERLRGRLRRWQARRKPGDGWKEVTEGGANEPHYLFQVKHVWPIIEKLLKKVASKKTPKRPARKTSSKRPASDF